VTGRARIRQAGRLAVLGAVVGLALAGAVAQAARDDVDLVSRASGVTGAKGNDDSYRPQLSSDGRFIVFISQASNLRSDDGDGTPDVYVRDLQTGTTRLVSRASGAAGVKSNGNAYQVAISGDGRYVAFDSEATSLDPDDADTGDDVYVRDLQTDTTTLVSRAAGGAKANADTDRPALSADGRLVAFTSSATNLDPDDGDNALDVYVRDLQTHAVTLVSRATGADGAKCNEHCEAPAISADGRFVAFESRASNLDPADGDGVFDVMVRDLQTSTTMLVSRASGVAGAKSDGESFLPAISGDGRFVAFTSSGSNLDPADADAIPDVYVRDLQTGTTTLVSRAGGATGAVGNGGSDSPAISSDGRYIAFASEASNLDPDDGDTAVDVFVRDLQTNTTTLVSRAAGETGANGNAASFYPALSGDGRFAAFYSRASNLHPGDGDAIGDVFRRQLGGNGRPTAAADAYAAAPNTRLAVAAPGVLANDGDPDGDPLTAQVVSGPAHGTLALSPDGSFTYTPTGGYSDPDSFAYGVSDGVDSSTATATITVNGGPAPPAPVLPPPPPVLPAPAVPTAKPLCQARPATIVGTARRDVLRGTPGPDVIVALGGNDIVRGLGGHDRVCAGAAADRVAGGAGADRLQGGAGRDLLIGDRGKDLLLGGPGADTMRGGPGNDRAVGGAGHDRSFP
jgi:Tol biopolymer transport system component